MVLFSGILHDTKQHNIIEKIIHTKQRTILQKVCYVNTMTPRSIEVEKNKSTKYGIEMALN